MNVAAASANALGSVQDRKGLLASSLHNAGQGNAQHRQQAMPPINNNEENRSVNNNNFWSSNSEKLKLENSNSENNR